MSDKIIKALLEIKPGGWGGGFPGGFGLIKVKFKQPLVFSWGALFTRREGQKDMCFLFLFFLMHY